MPSAGPDSISDGEGRRVEIENACLLPAVYSGTGGDVMPDQVGEPQSRTEVSASAVTSPEPVSRSFLARAVRNFLYSGLGTVASYIISFLFAGLSIRYLGEARAGFFMSLAALTGVNAFLGDFGLGTPIVRRVAALNAQESKATAGVLVGSVFTISLGSSLVIAVLIITFSAQIFAWSRLDAIYREDTLWAILLTMGGFVLGQVSNPWRAVYTALERYDLISLLNTVFGILSGVCGVLVLSAVPSMAAIASVRLTLGLVRFLLDAYMMRRLLRVVPWPAWAWHRVRPMLNLGGWVYLGTVGQFLLTKVNSLVLTTFLGSAALPYYEFPQRIYRQAHAALASQYGFLFPMFASYGENAAARIRGLEDRLRWFLALSSGTVYTGLALVGSDVLRRLVSPDFAAGARIPLYLACAQGTFHAQAIVPYRASWAVGSGKANAFLDLSQGTLVALTAFLLIPRMGFIGASIAHLWVAPIAVVHTLWVRQVISPGADRWAWLRPMVSPGLMIIIWILTVEIGTSVATSGSIGYYLLVLLGGGIGWSIVWLVERLVFPSYECWETLMQAARVVARRRR
jgi:O-antigen/teichoic acid export membrane protein